MFSSRAVLARPSDDAWELASDVALVSAVRAGETGAREQLLERHGAQVEAAAALVPQSDPARAFSQVVDSLDPYLPMMLPFRVSWLAATATTDGQPVELSAGGSIWRAFVSLSPAWQAALWHHEVEGEDSRVVARIMGVDPETARRAAGNARAAMNRRVTHAHTAGASPECLRIHAHLVNENSAVLGGALTRVLREHARHCDDCLPLVCDVLRLEHTLREVLADRVLGEVGAAYLRTRPTARPMRASTGTPVAYRVARRSLRPVLSLALAGATAVAVASVLVLQPPHVGGSSLRADGAPSPVAILPSPTQGLGLGLPTDSAIMLASAGLVDTPGPRGAGAGRGPEPVAGDPGGTTDPTTTPVPTPGPTDGGPGSDPGGDPTPDPGDGGGGGGTGGSEPPPPGDGGSTPPPAPVEVQVDPDAGTATVVVDVPGSPTGPIVVTTPPLPTVPTPPLPTLPTGGLVTTGVTVGRSLASGADGA